MIILDNTTRLLQVLLGGAITTNQLHFTAQFVDVTETTYTPISSNGVTNSPTPVTLVAAPGSSTQRVVKYLSIYNADTANATVTVRYNDNATLRTLCVITLATLSLLEYTDTTGFGVILTSGVRL